MKSTHKTRLLEYLKTFGHITSIQAIQDLGNTRLSATIHDLRHKDGYIIFTDMVEVGNRFGGFTKVARYTADKNPITNELKKSVL